jgi:outer membrane protein assembly factor BamB
MLLSNSASPRSHARRFRGWYLVSVLALGAVGPGLTVSAHEGSGVIVLPGARSAESVTTGKGSTFYAGELFSGDIFKGDLRTGTVERFIHAPAGRLALGIKADVRHGLLFVAGGFTGQAYVYDLETGADLATFQLGAFINDVVITEDAAWFTDSALPHLYRIPVHPGGSVRTLIVTGPAANLSGTSGTPNLNGIAVAPDGRTLIVSHSSLGALFTVNPRTGASALIDGVPVPFVDGILVSGDRLYAAQIFLNQIAEIALSRDLSRGTVERIITSPLFESPTSVARHGDRLAVVNSKIDTGFPPTAATYEVVVVEEQRDRDHDRDR